MKIRNIRRLVRGGRIIHETPKRMVVAFANEAPANRFEDAAKAAMFDVDSCYVYAVLDTHQNQYRVTVELD